MMLQAPSSLTTPPYAYSPNASQPAYYASANSNGADQAFATRGDGAIRPPAAAAGSGGTVPAEQAPPQPPHLHVHPRQHQAHAAVRLSPPNNLYPMAAPPLPQTPTTQQQQQQQQPAATTATHMNSPKSPSSASAATLDQKRITLLFEINVQLLQEVNRLQSLGQGGAISPQQLARGNMTMASEEYIQCLRRVQANLAYLMPMAQQGGENSSQGKGPPGPAHMTPPPHLEGALGAKYEALRELFPGWAGMGSQSSASPRPNGMAAGSPGAA